jgi:hypothetical protein
VFTGCLLKWVKFGGDFGILGVIVYVNYPEVGNVSPKHYVGDSRFDPVSGRQFVLPSGWEYGCQPKTGAKLPSGNATVDKTKGFHLRLPTFGLTK